MAGMNRFFVFRGGFKRLRFGDREMKNEERGYEACSSIEVSTSEISFEVPRSTVADAIGELVLNCSSLTNCCNDTRLRLNSTIQLPFSILI